MIQRYSLSREIRSWIEQSELGPIHQFQLIKQRPWSTVIYFQCAHGNGYFKQCGPGSEHEPALMVWLQPHFADFLPSLLSYDLERKWFLTREAGQRLRDLANRETQFAAVADLLPVYAKLQQLSIRKRAELENIVLPNRGLASLPAGLENLIANSHYEQILAVELIKAIAQQLPRLRHDCYRLAASPYSLALDHGDLHAGNILYDKGAITLIDWGDSAHTHPFTCLVATFEAFFADVIAFEHQPAAQRLRDIYLDQFPGGASLQTEFREVIILGDIVRALVMDRILQSASSHYISRWGPFMAKWLTRWLKNVAKQ